MVSYSTSAIYVLAMVASLLAALMAAGFFCWGRLMGRVGLRSHSTKWKTYTFTLAPTAILALSCLNHEDLQPMAWKIFFTLSCPALLGVFHRWHWGSGEFS
jgi:MFS family permease